jgi:adenylate cyclase
MRRLMISPGQPGERLATVEPGRNLVGRAEDCNICIAHRSLSRQHAELLALADRVVITDLNSKNGTFVNSARVQSAALQPGDVIRCGEVTLVYEPTDFSQFVRHPTLFLPIPDSDPAKALTGMLSVNRTSRGSLKIPTEASDPVRRKLDILLRIAQLLSAPDAISKLQETVIDLAFQVFDIDSAALLLVNKETGLLEPRLSRMKEKPLPDEVAFSHSIANYVRRERVGAVFTHPAADNRLADAPSIVGQSIQAAMCAPLNPRNEVIGVLYVDNRRSSEHFSEEDLAFLVAFANQVGIALENADLYQRLEREAVQNNNLRRFFPPATLKQIQERGGAALESIELGVTVLFCDISDFTTISGEMEPRDVLSLLNEFFPAMAAVIFKHDGTLEKYIGDAMLAVWGAPFGRPDDADRALSAAVDLQRTLSKLNERWLAEGRSALRIHIGLSSGKVAAGNIGWESYLQYATIGEPTNIASRVCNFAGPGEIVISSTTKELLRNHHGQLTALGNVALKGKKQPVPLYRLEWQPITLDPPTIVNHG